MDCFQVIAPYKNRNPSSDDETEHLENLFNALCCTLMSPATRTIFVEAEGVELMVLILKQKRAARAGALKALVSQPPAELLSSPYRAICHSNVDGVHPRAAKCWPERSAGLKTLLRMLVLRLGQAAKQVCYVGEHPYVHISILHECKGRSRPGQCS